MLKRKLMMFWALVAVTLFSAAAERIVDGVGGATNRYATIAAAVTASATGDTIRILNGIYSEATVAVTKRLIFLGNGYRTVANGGTHLATSLDLQSGSDNSRVVGFRFLGSNGVTISNASNIVVANNLFINGQVYIYSSNTDTVRNNIFLSASNHPVYIYGSSNIVVCNNVIDQNRNASYYAIYTYSISGPIYILNNFFSECYYTLVNAQSSNANHVFTGNIYYKSIAVTNAANDALLYSGNLLWNMDAGYTQPSNGTDNYTTSDPLFVKFETSTGFVYNDDPANDPDLRLQNGTSDAVDRGYDAQAPMNANYIDYHPSFTYGTAKSDAGIYGGPYPFPFPYGYPTVPSVTKMAVSPSVVSPGGTINVNITGSLGGFTGRGN